MQITCKKCGADIPAENINLDRLIAKCSQCNAVFSIADRVGTDKPGASPTRLDVPQPDGITLQHNGTELIINRRWYSLSTWGLVLTTLLMVGFLIVFSQMFSPFGFDSFSAISKLYPIILGALILYLGYLALADLLNTTTIRVSSSSLEVRHSPLPYPGNITLDAQGIKQLYTVERLGRGRNSPRVRYEVLVITDNGTQQILLKGLRIAEQALFIEQEIEHFLHIADVPVRGEY